MLEIHHHDLARSPAEAVAATDGLVVLWWGDWPVGQAYLTAAMSRDEAVAALNAAAAPDVLERAKALLAEEAGRAAPERKVSVVICTRDRPGELERCLASLKHQSLPPAEVVVVDNASVDDRTRRVAEAAGVVYVREDRPGLDIARNTGALRATGDIVAYTDDDVALHPRWLERLAGALDEPHVMAVTGLVLPGELATEAQVHFETLWGFGRGYRRIDFGRDFFSVDRAYGCPAWEVGAGASMAFRREVFERVGYFDERLDVGAAGCSGDSEYWHRVLTHGFACRYEPSSVAYHFHRREMDGLARQIFAYMRGHSAALLVQFERSGHWGNLRRALVSLPIWYGRRWLRRWVRGATPRDRFLKEEISGFVSGVVFYLKAPRPKLSGLYQ